jgi:hypothetical protein
MATKPWTDPIVEEVRRWREEMMREVDGDLEKLCQRMMDERKKRGDPLKSGREAMTLEELQSRIRELEERERKSAQQ